MNTIDLKKIKEAMESIDKDELGMSPEDAVLVQIEYSAQQCFITLDLALSARRIATALESIAGQGAGVAMAQRTNAKILADELIRTGYLMQQDEP